MNYSQVHQATFLASHAVVSPSIIETNVDFPKSFVKRPLLFSLKEATLKTLLSAFSEERRIDLDNSHYSPRQKVHSSADSVFEQTLQERAKSSLEAEAAHDR